MPSGQGRQARLPFLVQRARAQSLALAITLEIALARQDNVRSDAIELRRTVGDERGGDNPMGYVAGEDL